MNKTTPFTSAILLAGGSGSRVGESVAKQWLKLCGESVFQRCVNAWASVGEIDELIVVVRAEDEQAALEMLKSVSICTKCVIGGKNRAESAKQGFSAISEEAEYVAVADVARCLIAPEDIQRVLCDAYKHGAASAVCAVTDTVKVVEDGVISRTIPREQLLLAQTPQVFRAQDYRRALSQNEDLSIITDDNMLLETIGIHPYPTYLREENPKLTNKEDIERFEALIKKKEKKMTAIRVGNGYDAHRFVEGRPLVLGGVEIPFEYGLLGHSDADVLLHAIMDALLGALSLGDIGKHFPDSDEAYRGISSVNLLLSVAKMMREHGATLVNLDATMVIQRPKISPYINNMVDNIAFALSVPRSCINIKATTEEGMGFTGRMEGASAYAVCILSVENN